MVRLNWWQRPLASVPISLRSYCIEQEGSDCLAIPGSLDALLRGVSGSDSRTHSDANVDLDAADAEHGASMERRRRAVIVVTTCGAAGAIPIISGLLQPSPGLRDSPKGPPPAPLLPSQCASGIFDFVIVDEASQATEAETLVPLSLCKRRGYSVLAGDPHQLGARVRSPLYHLDGSLNADGRQGPSLPVGPAGGAVLQLF